MASIFQQMRRVTAGNIQAEAVGLNTDLDMDISVKSTKGNQEFEVGLWNLNDSSWKSIKKAESCVIEAGWLETGMEPICEGTIQHADFKYENGGADTRYFIRGVDATKPQFAKRFSKTYIDSSVSAIATDIAEECNASPVIVEDAGVIDGYWPIKDDHAARYWLERLVNEAQKLTGEQWKWACRRGQFFFHRKTTESNRVVRIWSDENGNGNLQSAEKSTGKSDSDESDDVEVTCYMEPLIEIDSHVNLDSVRFSGGYKVTEYHYESDTVDGTHAVTATLTPTGAKYTSPYPGVFSQLRDIIESSAFTTEGGPVGGTGFSGGFGPP